MTVLQDILTRHYIKQLLTIYSVILASNDSFRIL